LYDSIELANAAAGIVVREIGTAAVTPEELAGAFPA
jgi:bifunctional ADP-heptose synthase (sugar kinase/adenylyltransferase)